MNFCSQCGETVTLTVPADDDRPKLVVGCIPVWEDRILMCRRDIEPRRGYWTLPAGFLEIGETAAEGARRETLEETGSRVVDLTPYLMVDIVPIHQIYLMFRSQLAATDFHPTRESVEVKLLKEADIPWSEIAFTVIEKTLRYFLQDWPTGRFGFHTDRIDQRLKRATSG